MGDGLEQFVKRGLAAQDAVDKLTDRASGKADPADGAAGGRLVRLSAEDTKVLRDALDIAADGLALARLVVRYFSKSARRRISDDGGLRLRLKAAAVELIRKATPTASAALPASTERAESDPPTTKENSK